MNLWPFPPDLLVLLSSCFNNIRSNTFSKRNVHNAIYNFRKTLLNGRTPSERLIEDLQSNQDYFFSMKTDENNRVASFFFAKKDSIKVFRRFPDVLVMDATHKTNRYRMPLLEVSGLLSSNKTYILCAAFMKNETVADYVWALKQMKHFIFINGFTPTIITTDRELALMSAIEQQLPGVQNLLCRWHIMKNVLTKLTRAFPALSVVFRDAIMNQWAKIVSGSSTIGDFEAGFVAFRRQLEEATGNVNTVSEFIFYLENTWLDNYKER